MPSWLSQLPVTAAVRHAVDTLRNLIPEGGKFIDIQYVRGRVDAGVIEPTAAQAAAALMLMSTAAMRYEALCETYGETISETDQRQPEALQLAVTAFDQHTLRTLGVYVNGHVIRGEMYGSIRVSR